MLTQSELKNKLTYNPETGLFGRKNKIAGSLRPNGYIQIGINKKLFRAHRLAFLYMTGEWPKSDVDHIDMDRKNNKWANLREATRTQNNMNRKVQPNNTSGFKGVSWSASRKRWIARTMLNNKYIHLGSFVDINTAKKAYLDFSIKQHGEFFRPQSKLHLLC